MRTSSELSDLIKELSKQNNVKIKDLLNGLGLSINILSTMKSRGTYPTVDTLFKIAEYFDVSIDYLLGRTDTPCLNVTSSYTMGNSPMSAQGNNNNIIVADHDQRDSMVDEMVNRFNALDFADKIEIMQLIISKERI